MRYIHRAPGECYIVVVTALDGLPLLRPRGADGDLKAASIYSHVLHLLCAGRVLQFVGNSPHRAASSAPHGDKREFLGVLAAAITNKAAREYALSKGFFVIEPSGEDVKISKPVSGVKIR
jgi:hypothetical protein